MEGWKRCEFIVKNIENNAGLKLQVLAFGMPGGIWVADAWLA